MLASLRRFGGVLQIRALIVPHNLLFNKPMLIQGLVLLGMGLFATVVTVAMNWLALKPFRRANNLHWTERARILHPIRMTAISNLLVFPAVLTFLQVLIWPQPSPYWALSAIVTALGTMIGTIPMDHEMFPRIEWKDLLRQVAIACLFRFLIVFVFIGAMASMPDRIQFELCG